MSKWASESERVAAYRKRVAAERRALADGTGLDVIIAELTDLEEQVAKTRRLVVGVVERLATTPPTTAGSPPAEPQRTPVLHRLLSTLAPCGCRRQRISARNTVEGRRQAGRD